jgi:polar amino acid transport system substrate-binding protein
VRLSFKSTRMCAAAALLAMGLAAAGCGSSNSNGGGSSGGGGSKPSAAPTADKAVAKLVPANIKSKGTLTVATDPTYAPNEFVGSDGKTVVGMDADLAKALAGVMGLKAKVVRSTFDAIIPGLASGKYDLGMSSFTDTKEREKTVDFVTYFSAGTSFYVKAQGGPAVNSLADLCGKTVAVEKGTTQQTDSTAQSKKCTSAGKPAVKVLAFPDQNGANLALSSGRAAVGMADSPVAAYQVKQSGGQFKLSGKTYGTAPYGIAIPKTLGLDKAVLAGVKALMADGRYQQIMKKWGIASGAITNPQINGATS